MKATADFPRVQQVPMDIAMMKALSYVAVLTSSWSALRIGPSNVSDIALTLSAVAILLITVRRRTLAGLRAWMVLPAAVGAVVLAANVVIANMPLAASPLMSGIGVLPFFSRMAFATLGPALLALAWYNVDRKTIPRLLDWWLGGIVVSSLVAVLQTQIPFPELAFLEYSVGTTSGRYPGLSSHPNALAQAATIALPIAAIRLTGRRKHGGIVFIATVLPVVAAIVISGSRAGIVVALCTAAILLFLLFSTLRLWIWAPPVVLLLGAAAFVYLPGILSGTRLGDGTASQSDVGRRATVERGIDLFAQQPVWGAGMGSWYGEFGPLILLTSGGLLLLVAYLLFLSAPIMKMLSAPRSSFLACILLSVAAQLAFFLSNNGLFERFVYWPLLVGYFAARSGTEPEAGQASVRWSA